MAEVAHEAKAVVASTFATPIGLRPVELGADYVIQSLTRCICGHGDAIGGALVVRKKQTKIVRKMAIHMGGIMSPFDAWSILRGLVTRPPRMAAHQETAFVVAGHLEKHPAVTRVMHPRLPSHPQHELARRQMDNFSGIVTFQVKDGPAAAKLLSDRLGNIRYAVSLGHVRPLMCYLGTVALLRSSFHLTSEQEVSYRAFAGDGMFRLSVRFEDPADLIADLDNALAPLQ